MLRGRRSECETLDGLAEGVRGGRSAVLLVLGDAGVGKTALLDYLVESAADLRVVRTAGVEAEMDLAFAALHRLCGPVLERLGRLPVPQRDALGTAFGLTAGPAPDRFLVGLAVLSLLYEVAAERPLVCVIDDAQWLDRASAQALAFAARRLTADPVGLVFAARESDEDLGRLPELVVEGLREPDARELLGSVVRWPLDERVADQIVAETRGNPLALLELPWGLSPAELAGGFGLPDVLPLPGRIEDYVLRRVDNLPGPSWRLLVVAAAESAGDPVVVWRAATRLGISAQAAAPAAQAGLLEIGARVRFQHPRMRAAAYRAASPQQRRAVHRALAEATDPQLDPDRRAWHRAQAAAGPDEDVAAELERSADRARARGGLAAAAAFLGRAAALTSDPARRADRALAAAAAKVQAGTFDAALEMLGLAEAGPPDELRRARTDLVRAQLAFVSNRGSDAPPLLLRAARQLEGIDVGLARATYLDAMNAAMSAGHLADPGGGVLDVSRAAGAAPPRHPPRPSDHLLDGLAAHFSAGYSAGVPILRRALTAVGRATAAGEELRWLGLACAAALHLWDDEKWDELSGWHVELARGAGALSQLPLALSSRAYLFLFAGDLAAAAALVEEAQATTDATGGNLAPYGALGLAAWRGREDEADELIEASRKDVTLRGEGIGVTLTNWANAVLYNGLGRYDAALAAAERGSQHPCELGLATWSTVELIEAAARTGRPERGAEALPRLAECTSAAGTDWALGIQARSRALLTGGELADRLYREAIGRLGRTRIRAELARAHLLYGEWLRRQNRRVDAREQLRAAYQMLTAIGAAGFAQRARRELLATGETVRKRTSETVCELTAQEAQIARLAGDGRTNPEIGAELFLSPRTVEWHLRKVFTKLGIGSRRELREPLPAHGRVTLRT
jgi:DNA-binding CsgD family transcriptional regulator